MHGDYVYPEFVVAYRRTVVPPVEHELGPEPEPQHSSNKKAFLARLDDISAMRRSKQSDRTSTGSVIPGDGTQPAEPEPEPDVHNPGDTD